MSTYREMRSNPAIRYRSIDLETLHYCLRNPIDDAHKQRVIVLIAQKEAEIEEILTSLQS